MLSKAEPRSVPMRKVSWRRREGKVFLAPLPPFTLGRRSSTGVFSQQKRYTRVSHRAGAWLRSLAVLADPQFQPGLLSQKMKRAKSSKDRKQALVTIRVSPALKQAAEKKAEAEDRSLSYYVARLIARDVAGGDKKKARRSKRA